MIPKEFILVARALASPVPETTPSWDDIIVPFADDPANLAKIKEIFDDSGLLVTNDAIDAVQKEYRMAAAFLYDYGDICEGLEQLKVEDLDDLWKRVIQKIIRNIVEHDDPGYDPAMKALQAFNEAAAKVLSSL